jgi:hypothetical protein
MFKIVQFTVTSVFEKKVNIHYVVAVFQDNYTISDNTFFIRAGVLLSE